MTPEALNTLARDIAEAAAKCVGAEFVNVGASARTYTAGESAVAACSAWAGEWSARVSSPAGHNGSAALNSAAVLALRDRVVAQREERARLLAADDAALRVIDAKARVYDVQTVAEAVARCRRKGDEDLLGRTLKALGEGAAPWTRSQVDSWDSDIADACDVVIRSRAGGGGK